MGAQLWLGGETALSGISIYASTVQPTNAEKSFDKDTKIRKYAILE